ncbi:MAG TPA: protein kinase [Gemmatimonadales bacterium]|nr:protein kinase [Gemmatimonadales bacterium]
MGTGRRPHLCSRAGTTERNLGSGEAALSSPDTLADALSQTYRIERRLGAGGMATVYLAEDLRHRRQVAIKVLRPELGAIIGGDRFLAEISTTAKLQHPHILPLFDSGAAAGLLYYVMPYVEGESLRDRLDREKQLPIADCIRIASEVASALDYAHRHSIIHRDIKPENILLHDGTALVADFGIALAVSQAGGSSRLTETGISLGTPSYMSPEQAMGEREITARSDVYSLGAILYEMLLGEPPFTGPTAQAVVARMLSEDPRPPSTVRRSVPPEVDDAVLTALQELPADRFGTAAEFARALQGTPSGANRAVVRRAAEPPSRQRLIWLAAAAAILLPLAFWLGSRFGTADGTPVLGAVTPITWDAGLEVMPSISPDGRNVAYAAGAAPTALRIFVRPIAGGRPVAVTDEYTTGQFAPRWSPDGSRILFLSGDGAFSAPAFGGQPRPELPPRPQSPVTSAVWSPDGKTIAWTAGDTLFLRNGDGRSRALVAFREPALCDWSPDGSRLACSSGNREYARATWLFGNLSPSSIAIVRVAEGSVAMLTDALSANQSPAWAGNDEMYFVSSRHGTRDIYHVKVAPSGAADGPVTRLSAGLGAHTISLAADKSRVAFAAFSATANIWRLPVPDRPPVSAYSATQVTFGNQLIEIMALSHDGRWLYYDSNLAGNGDIYRVPAGGGSPERLTTNPADDFGPAPSPDGAEFAFHSWRTGNRDVFVQPLDGRPVQQVTATDRQEVVPQYSPDGKALTYFEYRADSAGRGAAWISRRKPDGTWDAPAMLVPGAVWPVQSHDGRLLVYGVGFSSPRIYLRTVGDSTSRLLYDAAATNGPTAERLIWSEDNRTIYFKSHAESGEASIWGIGVDGGPPRRLVTFEDLSRPSARLQLEVGAGNIYFAIEEQRSDVSVMEIDPGGD